MANPKHIKMLMAGAEVWNEWRGKRRGVFPDLNGASLGGVNLAGADLRDADLRGADLSGTDLRGADLRKTRLQETSLIGTQLRDAQFCGSYIALTDFNEANLKDADFSRALIVTTTFRHADLSGANFTNVKFGFVSFADNDLSDVKGLETVEAYGPSSIGIDTFYKSRGQIPEKFLRDCGVPEDFITYMRSLVVQPIQFYTCFISFTEADDAFSERLYNDMQAKGVRCWRWKEDAKWGKTLMRSIDEAVRVYDKLIVICSEQSLNAPAMIREIERALQKEDDLAREGRDAEVLFPIRLDDYIFTGWKHHRKADVTAKNVGDFRQWKQHDQYQKAFDRLLRDLKADDKKA